MGGYVSKSFDQNMKKNQEFMLEVNRITMERQIQMQNQMRERMLAMQIARARDLFYWFGSFYGIAAFGMIGAFRKTKRPGVLFPLLPLTFVLGYQADMAYGNKLLRIKAEAENVMQFESELLSSPFGLPTLSSIDLARAQQKEEKLLHSAQPTVL